MALLKSIGLLSGAPVCSLSQQDMVDKVAALVNDGTLSHLLVLVVDGDGRSWSFDNGLDVDEAMELTGKFRDWIQSGTRKLHEAIQ